MDELLLWLGRLALVVALLPAFFTTWFLAGADDTPRNSVAPFVGFGVMSASIAAVVIAFRDDVPVDNRTLLISAAPMVLAVMVWPISGTRARGRPPVRDLAESVVVFAPAPTLLALSRLAS